MQKLKFDLEDHIWFSFTHIMSHKKTKTHLFIFQKATPSLYAHQPSSEINIGMNKRCNLTATLTFLNESGILFSSHNNWCFLSSNFALKIQWKYQVKLSQKEKDKYHDITYMWNLKYDINELICETDSTQTLRRWGRNRSGVWDQQKQTHIWNG